MIEYPLIATRSELSQAHEPNLKPLERAICVATGGALLVNGLRKGGLSGIIQACLGAYGLMRGASGNCALKKAITHTPFEEEFQHEHGWKHSEAVSRSITVRKPRAEVIAFIREPENIGRLMHWVDSVKSTGQNTSIWTAHVPLGGELQWNLKLEEARDDLLRWTTGPDSRWQHEISVHIKEAPASRGTEVKVVVVGKPPLGIIGYAAAAAISQFTDKALLNVLHSIKQQLETGEVSTNQFRPDQSRDAFYLRQDTGATQPRQLSARSVKTGIVLEGGNA